MSRARVLVVDDEPGMLRAIERVLGPGYAVATARSPSEGLIRVAGGFAPDLALLDIRMPEMSGFELMDRLRQQRPDVDVIFMTGSINQLDAQLIQAIRRRAFYFIQKPFDREVLLTLVERCLDQRRLTQENRRHLSRLEEELEQARRFQQSLLPPEHSTLSGVEIAARCVQYAGLGGDFVDYAAAGTGGVTLLVADICGHGTRAAMVSGMIKSAFHAAGAEGYSPLSVIAGAAQILARAGHRRFVTMFCATIDPQRRTLTYCSAGHPPALLRRGGAAGAGAGPAGAERAAGAGSRAAGPRAGGAAGGETPAAGGSADRGGAALLERLDATGTIICADLSEQEWTEEQTPFEPGDQLVVYTDGVIETAGPEGLFGIERLEAIVRSAAARGGGLLSRALQAAHDFAHGHPADDDQTLVVAAQAE